MARNIIRWTAFIIPLVAFTGVAGSAKDNVEIRLSGRFFAEPATVQLVVAIEPVADNRTLRVEAEGDTMFSATEIRNSFNLDRVRTRTINPRAHLVEEISKIDYFRFASYISQGRGTVSERCCHHQVFCAGDGHFAKLNVGSFQPAVFRCPRNHVTRF